MIQFISQYFPCFLYLHFWFCDRTSDPMLADKLLRWLLYSFYVGSFTVTASLHCTKDHISQVLEYHGKVKKTRKYHLSINFLAEKKTIFLMTEKFKTRTFQ